MSVIIKIAGNSDSYAKELQKVKGQTKALENQLSNIAKKSGIAFAALTGTIGLAVKQYADFEHGLRSVKTLLDENSFGTQKLSSGFKQMEKDILKVAGAYPIAMDGLNKSLFDTVSAGVKAGDAVEFVGVAAKLAVAGVTDVSIATDGLTSAMNAYGLEADSAESLAAKFFTTQKFGKTTVEELAQGFGLVASTAASMGVSLDELFASVGAVTAAGVRTNQTYSGMAAILANISKPTADATKEAKRLGIQFDAAALRAKGFKGFLDQVTESQNFNKDSVTKLFGSLEAVKVMYALTGTSAEKFGDILGELSNEQKAAITLQKAYEEQSSTLTSEMQKLRNNVQIAAIAIGSKFAPLISRAAKALQGFVVWFNENPKIAEFAAYVLGAGAALTGIVTAAALAAQGFLALRAAAIVAGIGMKAALISTGIGALIVGLGIIIADLALNWKTRWAQMQAVFQAFTENIKPILIGLGLSFAGFVTGNFDLMKQGMGKLTEAFSAGLTDFNEIMAEKEKEWEAERLAQQEKDLISQGAHSAAKTELSLQLMQEKHDQERELADEHAATDFEVGARNEDAVKLMEQQSYINRLKNFQKYRGAKLSDLGVMNSEELSELGKKIKTESEMDEQLARERLEKQTQKHNQFLKNERQFGKGYASIQEALNSGEVRTAQSAANSLVGLQRSKNSTLKAIGKGAALTQIGIDTAKGATSAYAAMAGIPLIGPALGIAAAIAVVAFGAERAADVLSANKGGIVPMAGGGRAGVDSIPAIYTPGEVVTPTQSYDELIHSVSQSRLHENAGRDNRSQGVAPAAAGGGGSQSVTVFLELSDEASQVLTAQQIRDVQLGTSKALSGA